MCSAVMSVIWALCLRGSWIQVRAWSLTFQGASHKWFMSLWLKSREYSLSSNSYFNDLFRSQFCTCHDSWAVVGCAKLWPDLIIFHLKWRCILQNFRYELINHLWNGAMVCSRLAFCWFVTQCGWLMKTALINAWLWGGCKFCRL